MPEPNAWVSLWRTVLRIERNKIQPWIAARNTIGVALPLSVAVALGRPDAGLVTTMGALNVAFSDGSDPYLPRARRMLAASLAGSFAVAVGAICGNHQGLAIAAPVLWALGAGMLVALDAAAADIGVITLVMLVVFAGQPMQTDHAIASGVLALSGGLLQTAISVGSWPFRRFEPERRALGTLYRQIAETAGSPGLATSAPAGTAEVTQAREVLSPLLRSRSTQAERYLSLLYQAERLRLAVMMLSRMQVRFGREGYDAIASHIGQCLAAACDILRSVADSIESGATAGADPNLLNAVHESAEALRAFPEAADASHDADALAGQLRAVIDLSASSTPSGRRLFERAEDRRPWRLRFIGPLATLRANFTPRAAAFQHAIRLAICIGIGEVLVRTVSLGRAYWVPMTIAIVLKPDFASTFSRGVLRIVGTYVGLILTTVLFAVASPSRAVEVAITAVLAFLLRCFGPANYGVAVAALSAYIVVLFAILGVAPAEVIAERGWNTLVGGALALLAYATWPTWERWQTPGAMARLLDAYRAYFRAVRDAYTSPEGNYDRELDSARAEARLARSNLEASADRFASEPRVTPESIQMLGAFMATSHRLVHAIMALEAGLQRSRPARARVEFQDYANAVELTLHSLAAALRGSALPHHALPDLREVHRRLTQAGDPLSERYALVNVETDRITNSLNTLTGHVLRWTGNPVPEPTV